MVRRKLAVRCVADPGAIHASGLGGHETGSGVLHHEAVFRLLMDQLRGQQKDFRVRFGMGDLIAVRNGVEVTVKSALSQAEAGISAGRTDSQL